LPDQIEYVKLLLLLQLTHFSKTGFIFYTNYDIIYIVPIYIYEIIWANIVRQYQYQIIYFFLIYDSFVYIFLSIINIHSILSYILVKSTVSLLVITILIKCVLNEHKEIYFRVHTSFSNFQKWHVVFLN